MKSREWKKKVITNMELKMTKAGPGRKPAKIRVTDCDGNFKEFDSTKEAAEYMQCNVQSLYNAIYSKKLLRGCKIERI